MTVDPQAIRSNLQQRSIGALVRSFAWLALALLPAGALAAWVCSPKLNELAAAAAIVAVGVCWFSGALALTATWLGNRIHYPVQGVLLGMFVRMGLPLVTGMVLDQLGGPLAEASVFSMIMGVYLCGLVVETILSLQFIQSTSATALKVASR
jgi:hypothetical protein